MDEEIALRHLDQLERHIADARARLSRQRALIGRLGQLNAVADPERARAEAALFSIEDNISALEEQRRGILEKLGSVRLAAVRANLKGRAEWRSELFLIGVVAKRPTPVRERLI